MGGLTIVQVVPSRSARSRRRCRQDRGAKRRKAGSAFSTEMFDACPAHIESIIKPNRQLIMYSQTRSRLVYNNMLYHNSEHIQYAMAVFSPDVAAERQ